MNKSPLPKTREGLEAAGYKFSTKGTCSGCRAEVQWFVTPLKRWMPFDMPGPDGEFLNHWATCPQRDRFKKKS